MSTREVLTLCLVIIGVWNLFLQAKKEVTAFASTQAVTSCNIAGD